jgi:ATP-dependent Clp protease ATP-binding subunit ClpA
MIALGTSAEWLRRFDDLACCGYSVLLTGNTGDRHMATLAKETDPSWLPTGELITRMCQGLGYELILRYNRKEGTVLVDPANMLPLYHRARQDRGASEQPPPSPPELGGRESSASGTAGSSAPITPLPSRPRPEGSKLGAPAKERDQAIHHIATMLSQNEVATVVILDYADRLFTNNSMDKDLEDIIGLRRACERANYIRQGHALAGRKNLLVLITTGALAGVPSYLYQNHPQLVILEIPKPGRADRVRFIEQKLSNFCGGAVISGEQRERVISDLADLTDGMMVEELGKLVRLSVIREIRVDEDSKQVVNQLKYGERRDPWKDLDPTKIAQAEETIGRRILGQAAAVRVVARSLKHAKVGLSCDPSARGPKDVLLFAGPTGTGKTESAKSMAELLFGDSSNMTRLDMSEYREQHAAERLAGAPPGYVGYEEGGQLTNAVRAKPYQLILLDEIEKGHKCVWDKLLQVLEDGRMTDGRGQTAFFENTVLVFTSNVGAPSLIDTFKAQIERGVLPKYEEVRSHMLDAVREYFTSQVGRPEVFSRIGEERIVVFDLLRPDIVRSITRKFMDALVASAARQDIDLRCDASVEDFMSKEMLKANNLLMGGRRIKTLIKSIVENPLTDWISREARPSGMKLDISLSGDGTRLGINGENVAV